MAAERSKRGSSKPRSISFSSLFQVGRGERKEATRITRPGLRIRRRKMMRAKGAPVLGTRLQLSRLPCLFFGGQVMVKGKGKRGLLHCLIRLLKISFKNQSGIPGFQRKGNATNLKGA